MSKALAGRSWFALTAVVVAGAVVLQLILTARSSGDGFYPANPQRTLNLFAYFTIQSNLLLGATSLLLAVRPDRRSTLFRTLRLNGVLCIAVTGIVYHLALAGSDEPTGAAAVANQLLHFVTPVLGVVGWLAFGPRGRTDGRIVGWSVVFPLAWLAFTLVRGEFVGFYPYPFLDVAERGCPTVLLNSLLVAALFLALAAGLTALDRVLARRAASVR